MGFDLYPAIDLRGGHCVRLFQGDYAQETVYDDDPVRVAREFEAAGASWIHVVDLDAARTGSAASVQPLLSAGARVNVAIPSTGQTALMWAAAERHLPIVRELLAAGADVSATSTIGFTPLLFAVRNGDLDTAKPPKIAIS